MSVKFNDYFEFPREFDMAPYTASRLAEIEGLFQNETLQLVPPGVCKYTYTCTQSF